MPKVHSKLDNVHEKRTQHSKLIRDLISALEYRLATIKYDLPEPGVSYFHSIGSTSTKSKKSMVLLTTCDKGAMLPVIDLLFAKSLG